MNYVEPIRDVKKIERMKRLMRKEGKLKELVLFEIGIKTGLRISDILNLKWNSVFSELGSDPAFREVISIKEKKTRKAKQFHLSDNVRKVILEFWVSNQLRYEDYIFLSDSNNVVNTHQAWSRQYVWQFLNDYAYRVGIRDRIGAHTLRKTFGYHAFKNGVDLSLLMRIFNHSSQAVTLRYIGITQDQIDDVYVNLDKIL